MNRKYSLPRPTQALPLLTQLISVCVFVIVLMAVTVATTTITTTTTSTMTAATATATAAANEEAAMTTKTTNIEAAAIVMPTQNMLEANCWNNNNAEKNNNNIYETEKDSCSIRATLYMTAPNQREALDFGLPLDIDCTMGNESTTSASDAAERQDDVTIAGYTHNRGAGKAHVVLDGCHAQLAAPSYGLEYLAHCTALQSVTITRFHGDATLPLSCTHAAAAAAAGEQLPPPPAPLLTELYFRRNDIATIGAQSFAHLSALRVLEFAANALRSIECLTLPPTVELTRLALRQELHLYIKDAASFEQLHVRTLELADVLYVSDAVFARLPNNLETLSVLRTPIGNTAVVLHAPTTLQHVQVLACGLHSFELRAVDLLNVRTLNLSENALQHFSVQPVAANTLTSLDLSWNQLSILNATWLRPLPQLRRLYLAGNQLRTLSLPLLLGGLKAIEYVDLRSNLLSRLTQTEARVPCERARLQIDGNPWNCIWLVQFAQTQPEKFRLFQYEKFISQLNVNGLACQPQEPVVRVAATTPQAMTFAIDNNSRPQLFAANLSDTPLNVSTFTLIYGSPWEVKRNQKAEAWILVIMLPVGIALLFLLLYLWLHCQKLFHWSYYRSGMPGFGFAGWCKSNAAGTTRFTDRFDVVRFPPSASTTRLGNGDVVNGMPPPPPVDVAVSDGYETPISGVTSICNCPHDMSGACQKLQHVTYEALPTDSPYQLYAEIKEEEEHELQDAEQVDDVLKAPAQMAPTAPIYDHLSFEEVPLSMPADDVPAGTL